MAAVESAQFARYFELFPELTPTQAMTCILFSMGLAIPTIADLRDVSPETVRKVLQEARQKLDLSNLAAVTSAVQVRLTMAMMGCISIYGRNVTELHNHIYRKVIFQSR